MTREEAQAMWQAIKANRARLDSCPRHRFELPEPPYQLGQKMTCSNCGGCAELTAIFDYTKGYKAAGGNPCDIVPNWE